MLQLYYGTPGGIRTLRILLLRETRIPVPSPGRIVVRDDGVEPPTSNESNWHSTN